MLGIFLDDAIFMKAFPSGISKSGMLGSEVFSQLILSFFVGFEVELLA
jgi:hypothetical protein